MKTFKLTLSIDLKAIVPEQFEQAMREVAEADDASEFLKNTLTQFEDDADGFILHVLKHGLRRCVRENVQALFEQSGIGGTLSPVTANVIDRSPPTNTEPALATEIAQAIPA